MEEKKKRKFNYWVILWIAGMHLGALAAPFTFTWPAFFSFVFLSWLTGGIGITLCYHRLLTHQGFKVPRLLEYLFAMCGVLATEGDPINWVARHRLHHQFSDTDRDPHSPRHGFWWSHMFWLFTHKPLLDDYEFYKSYVQDLTRHRFYRFLNKAHIIFPILLAFALYFWGGLPLLVWGFFVRTVFVYHVTWFVNSATHKWGYKTYATEDDSRNLWWVALLSFGEGWHNNHHRFPSSARAGIEWYELDLLYYMLKALSWLGLVWDLREAPRPATLRLKESECG